MALASWIKWHFLLKQVWVEDEVMSLEQLDVACNLTIKSSCHHSPRICAYSNARM